MSQTELTPTTADAAQAGQLLHNLLLFGRLLHRLGLDVNPGRLMAVAQVFEHVAIGRRDDFYYALRTLTVQRKEQLPLFDQAFDLFWRRPHDGSIEFDMGELIAQRERPRPIVTTPALQAAERQSDPAAPDDDTQDVIELTATYSARERLAQKDFGELTGEELQAVKQLMAQLVWRLGQRLTRRREPGKGALLDLRRTVRRSLRHGGDILRWDRQTLRVKPRPLVVIADISGSMERYSRLLLHFLYSLTAGLHQRVEVFVFSTRLTRITRQLRDRDADRAVREAARSVQDWSGGTRIGDAIKTFNFVWGRRVLRGGAVALIISDGWDRGDPALLGREMQRLRRTTHRLIWLNPLLGSPRYEPLTRGLTAALPHVDDFLPVHNLASLTDLADHLALLDGNGRRRRPTGSPSAAAFIGRAR